MIRPRAHRARLAAAGLGLVLPSLMAAPALANPVVDGQIAYYQQGPGLGIHRMNPDGTLDAVVVRADGDQPSWAPGGQQIAFTSARDTGQPGYELYRIAPNGTSPLRLTSNAQDDDGASWSPDGTKIAFTSLQSGNYDIWVMDAGGTSQVNLTASSTSLDLEPTWSPDGAKIAFRSNRGGTFDIWVMDANGANPTQITDDHGFDSSPDWSPDGTEIAYTQGGSPNEVSTATPDGINHAQIVQGSYPSWSPSGARIAFVRDGDIYTATAAGDDVTDITNSPTVLDDHPAWGTYQAGPLTYPLWVKKSGSGEGTVSSSPAGVDCGPSCIGAFDPATQVTLTAAAGAGSSFDGWSGGTCGGTSTCVVSMDAARNVVASFGTAAYALTLTRSGTGGGSVSSSPAGVDCGSTCTASFAPATQVTLSATPDAISTFTGWSGSGCSGTGSCIVTMDQAHSVAAAFARATLSLNVFRSGTGSGTVSSSPSGIDCGSACSAHVDAGSTITLTATADATSTFIGWPGAAECPGAGTCTISMTQARLITAVFAKTTYLLSVGRSGAGGGTVSSSPAGIQCGVTCSATYDVGTSVTLTAAPNATSTFSGWSGEGCSGTGTCIVAMAQARSVVATFTPSSSALTVTKSGTGGGTVTSLPAGINCGNVCAAAFAPGAVVTLSPSPNGNATFTGWTGACAGTGSCILTMDQARAVTATFDLIPGPFLLTVTKAGTGGGLVTSSPAGITCGSSCSATFTVGTQVTLTATPGGALSRFAGWSGSGCSGISTCIVSMDQARAVTATFTPNGFPVADRQSVTLNEDGSVTIQLTGSDPDGDPLSQFRIWREPFHGTVILAGSLATYQPAPDYAGTDSFSFNVSDGSAGSNNALVSITVLPVNDPPPAPPLTLSMKEDTVLRIPMAAYDVDNDLLRYSAYALPAPSDVRIAGNVLTFTPGPNFNGSAIVPYCVSDGTDIECAEIDITVTPVPDVPVVTVGPERMTEGTATDFLYAFTDPDGQSVTRFTATIDWGDGATSRGHISYEFDSTFSVFGTHTYARFGSYRVSVTVVDSRDGTASDSATNRVVDAAIYSQLFDIPGKAFAGKPWGPFAVGCFSDANPRSVIADLSASIDWGDGTSNKNLTIAKATGRCKTLGWDYTVVGPVHTFAKAGTYHDTYKVVSVGGSKTSNVGSVVVK